eukprot:319463_1
MPRKKLTRAEVLKNRKSDIFIEGRNSDHCRICNYKFTNNIVWSDHKDTNKHRNARQKLLDALPSGAKRSLGGSAGGPQRKRQKVTTSTRRSRKLTHDMVLKNKLEVIVDNDCGFHHCRICDQTFSVEYEYAFYSQWNTHKDTDKHTDNRKQLLKELRGTSTRSTSNTHSIQNFIPQRSKYPCYGRKVLRLYHQTNKTAADAIKKSCLMKRGSAGMFGGGIYFAETKKDTNGKAHNLGYMIVADVFVGKEKKCSDWKAGQFDFGGLHAMGYDSVYAPKGSGSGRAERVVYNYDQVKIIDVYKI